MVVNKSCVAACLESVRMAVESVSGCSWSECPDQRGITIRMCVEWVSESAWNPHIALTVIFHIAITRAKTLDLSSRCTLGLVADEQHIMPLVTQHRF